MLPAISPAEEGERRGILTLIFDPNIINDITNREFTEKMAKWFTFYFRKGASIFNVEIWSHILYDILYLS